MKFKTALLSAATVLFMWGHAYAQGVYNCSSTNPNQGGAAICANNGMAQGASFLLPIGTTGTRPAAPFNGMIRYNTDSSGSVEAYVNGAWASLTGGGGGGSVTLGTSASATNPAKSGDATTGSFSDGVGLVEFSSSSTKEFTIGTTGILANVGVSIGTTTVAPTNGLVVTGNVGIGTNVPTATAQISAATGTQTLNIGPYAGSGAGSIIISAENSGTLGFATLTTTNLAGFQINSSGQGSSISRTGLVNPGGHYTWGINGSATVGSYTAIDAPANGLTITGQVGIGTSVPATNSTLDVRGPVKLFGYTVSTLPTGTVGAIAYVTDQLTTCAVAGAALTGGGAVTCPVFYNGTAWVGN